MWRGLASLLSKMALRKKNQGIIDLLLRKRDIKNYKEFSVPGSTGSRPEKIPTFLNWGDETKPLNVNLWRGQSAIPDERLKSPEGLHTYFGERPQSGDYWTNQVMKAMDYAEGAPFSSSKYKVYKPQDNLGVLRRGKFTGSSLDLREANRLSNYALGPEFNLPKGTIDDKMSLIPSIIARMRMRPEFKQTSLINYVKEILKRNKLPLKTKEIHTDPIKKRMENLKLWQTKDSGWPRQTGVARSEDSAWPNRN